MLERTMSDGQEPKPQAPPASNAPPSKVSGLGVIHAEPMPAAQTFAEREIAARARVNTQVRGWRLVRLLGVGPVSAAYEAVKGAKDAAERGTLKLMIGNIAKHEASRSVFVRAAYAANRFQHARVLSILEDGADEQKNAYVVRPWSEAEPLDALIARQGTLPELDVLRIAEQVLDALEMAHAHGILHGALAPGNILVTSRGSIRLCDFATPPGLGVRASPEMDGLAQMRASPFTAPERGAVPPQAMSEQADVYALAACMYFALSATYPRGDARTAFELAHAPARKLRDVAATVSEALATVIDHALSFDPIHRYESAYAMLGDVRRVMAGRRPKLSDSAGPIPSQSTLDLAIGHPASSRRLAASRSGAWVASGLGAQAVRARPQVSEWKGNLALVLAIALLAGAAAFVVVREKIEELRRSDAPKTKAAASSNPANLDL
jgi:eukaryotic-like serine/threonine-protein kinase